MVPFETPSPSRRRFLAGVGVLASAGGAWAARPLAAESELPDDRPAVVGHRGAAGVAPPNTAAGIRAALDAGADGVELDVRRTADGRLVLFHDPFLDLSTGGSGRVETHTWEEVRGLRIDGEPVLSLAEGLDEVAGSAVDLYLELKEVGYATDVVGTVRERGLLDRLTLLSFDAPAIEPVRDRVTTGLLGSVPREGLVDEAADSGASLVLSHYTPRGVGRFLRRADEAGLSAGTWELVGTERSVRDAVEAGPDVLVTNRPGRALDVLRSG